MEAIRVATYNVHKCRGMDRQVKPSRIAEVIEEMKVDVIGLQEVLSIGGGTPDLNQASYLANKLEMNLTVGENRRIAGGSYGNVVLSRFPLRSECNLDVTIAGYEPRGCLRTDVQLPSGRTLQVFNVHFGTGFLERRQQARMLLERDLLRRQGPNCPRILMGDFNEWTAGHLTRVLRSEFQTADIRTHMGRKRTYPGLLPFMHLDHIYYDRDLTVANVCLHRSSRALLASDHLPIMADFHINTPGSSCTDAPL